MRRDDGVLPRGADRVRCRAPQSPRTPPLPLPHDVLPRHRGVPCSSMSSQLTQSSGGVAVVARDLVQRYRSPDGDDLTVLGPIDVDITAGQQVAVVGMSGAGKSTLLSLIGGLERPTTGSLVVGDVDVTALNADDLAAYRRTTVGFVFQNFGLLPSLTARENVELAMSIAAVPAPRRRERADALLADVGLSRRANHLPGTMSG